MKRKYAYLCYNPMYSYVIIAETRGEARKFYYQYTKASHPKIYNIGRVHHTCRSGGTADRELLVWANVIKKKKGLK